MVAILDSEQMPNFKICPLHFKTNILAEETMKSAKQFWRKWVNWNWHRQIKNMILKSLDLIYMVLTDTDIKIRS